MASMMAPTLALDAVGLVAAAGAAGGTRLRSALVQVLQGVLDEGLEPQAAVDRPRLHPTENLVHLEPGWAKETIEEISRARAVQPWAARHHYFGGVSLIGRTGAAADPRRSGAALTARRPRRRAPRRV
jgi:gamma-glutamyltranspeptidase/glutathione hydrolase